MTSGKKTKIDVKLKDEILWLSQQLSELFNTSRTNVINHINNIYKEEKLSNDSNCQNFRQVQKENNRIVTRKITF